MSVLTAEQIAEMRGRSLIDPSTTDAWNLLDTIADLTQLLATSEANYRAMSDSEFDLRRQLAELREREKAQIAAARISAATDALELANVGCQVHHVEPQHCYACRAWDWVRSGAGTPADAQKALVEQIASAELDELRDTVVALWSDEFTLEEKKKYVAGRIADLEKQKADGK